MGAKPIKVAAKRLFFKTLKKLNLARKTRCALNLRIYFAARLRERGFLAVKFDLPGKRAVKFERKSLNLSLCKRPALPTCEVKTGDPTQ